MTCSPQDLLTAGKCFQCLTKKELQIVIAQLLCEISSSAAGESCFQCDSGIVPPVSPPDNPDNPASYVNTESGFTYNWDIGSQSWVPVPKVYRALINQSGTSAPVPTVFENTFGEDFVWTREGPGEYKGTLAGAFPASKTWVSVVAGTQTISTYGLFDSGPGDFCEYYTYAINFDDLLWAPDDGNIVMLEVLVYP